MKDEVFNKFAAEAKAKGMNRSSYLEYLVCNRIDENIELMQDIKALINQLKETKNV